MLPIIKPFKASYYNPSLFKDLSKLACPPYDVINKEKLKKLRSLSAYNFTNVLIADSGDYKKIGQRLSDWFEKKIVIDDNQAGLYLYEQAFVFGGKTFKRFGVLSLLKMDSPIFPHEHTLKKPKQDRAKVIKSVKANLDPIFIVVPKHLAVLHAIHKKYKPLTPFFKFNDCDGNVNTLWKIHDQNDISKICREMDKVCLVIADGHHRFEVAYNYFKANNNKFHDLNYILAYITDAQPGLLILPTHRINALSGSIQEALAKLSKYFQIKKISKNALRQSIDKTNSTFRFGLYWRGQYYVLRLKSKKHLISLKADEVFKKLDTYLLHNFVFPMIDINKETEYTHSIEEAIALAGKNKAAFILKAVALRTIFDIANKGLRFPQKSTYFQPKLFAGIILRRFEPL